MTARWHRLLRPLNLSSCCIEIQRSPSPASSSALVIVHPDLVHQSDRESELNEPRPQLFYGTSAEGYMDYPTSAEARELVA